MPLYEYLCTKCGHQFEMIQKFSDPIKTKCPKCGGRLEKLISAPAIQFKGSGWYVTDYGKGRSGGGADKPSSKSSGGGSSAGEASKEGGKDAGKPDKPAGGKSGRKGGGSKD